MAVFSPDKLEGMLGMVWVECVTRSNIIASPLFPTLKLDQYWRLGGQRCLVYAGENTLQRTDRLVPCARVMGKYANLPHHTQLFVVPEWTAEPEWHDELSDSDHYGTDVEAVTVHTLEPTNHVQDKDADDEALHDCVADNAQYRGCLLLQLDEQIMAASQRAEGLELVVDNTETEVLSTIHDLLILSKHAVLNKTQSCSESQLHWGSCTSWVNFELNFRARGFPVMSPSGVLAAAPICEENSRTCSSTQSR